MKIRDIHKETFESDILALDWNTVSQKAMVVSRVDKQLRITLKDAESWETISFGLINEADQLLSVSLNDNAELALIVFAKKSLIIKLEDFTTYKELERHEKFIKGSFGENDTIHFTIPASSGSVDWATWNYEENVFQEYQLERYDHYGRGAVLHPSKKLIGACWSAYQSGFLIHTTEPKDKRLRYFYFGDDECSRSEYEAHSPSFNHQGDKIAFVVNPYLGDRKNIEKLCCYHIEQQQKPLLEIALTDFEKEYVKETYFLGLSEYILLNKSKGIDIVDFNTRKKRRVIKNKVDNLTVDPINNKFMFSIDKSLKVYEIVGRNKVENTGKSLSDFTAAFISKFSGKLEIAGDKEVRIYTRISSMDEIPKVYVKYGFEKAIYRLDTKEPLEEKLSNETKLEVDHWFDENQNAELSQWRKNNEDR